MSNQLKLLLKASSYSGTGVWNDQSGYGNNATNLTGTIRKNTAGNGIVLDGSTTWGFSNLELGNLWSASIWVKPTSGNQNSALNYPFIVGQPNSAYNLRIGSFDRNRYWNKFDGLNNIVQYMLMSGYWYNIQATWDGTYLNTYINSNLINSYNGTGNTSSDNGSDYFIGKFIGEIGEVKIYNYALSRTQVDTDYNSSYLTYINNYSTIFVPNSLYASSWSGITCDLLGNLYSFNSVNKKVYKINSTGYGVIFADFTIFNITTCNNMFCDSNNNLYVVGQYNSGTGTIYKIDIFGNISFYSQFGSNIQDMCVNNNNIYTINAGVIKYLTSSSNTTVATIASTYTNITIDSFGKLYSGSSSSNNIIVLNPNNSYSQTTLAVGTTINKLRVDQNNMLVAITYDNKAYLIDTISNTKILLLSGTPINTGSGIVIDSLNNYYVTNSGNGVITKISQINPNVVASSIAGPGSISLISCVTDSFGNLYTLYSDRSCYQNGTLITVSIGPGYRVNDITIDSNNNLYISCITNDNNNAFIITKVIYNSWGVDNYYNLSNTNIKGITWTPNGIYCVDPITNILYLIDNSLNLIIIKKGLNTPYDVKVGPNGNFYIANYGNGTISVIDKTTFAKTTFASGFTHPYGLVFDQYGTLFVSDNVGYLYSVSPSGTITTIASGLSNPQYISYYNETIYVANRGNNTIATFSNYIPLRIPLNQTLFINPKWGGNPGNDSVYQMAGSPDGNLIVTAGLYGTSLYTINLNQYIKTISTSINQTFQQIGSDYLGNLYIANGNRVTIVKFNPTYGNSTFATGFNNIYGLCVIPNTNDLYVCDPSQPGNTWIYKITNNGTVVTKVLPIKCHRLAIDYNNVLYAATDYPPQSILKINTTTYTYIPTGTNIVYQNIRSMCIDLNNNLYVSDSVVPDIYIYKIDSSGFATLVNIYRNINNITLTCDIYNNINIGFNYYPNLLSGCIIQLNPIVANSNQQVLLLQATNYNNLGYWQDQSGNNNHATLFSGVAKLNEVGNGIILNGSSSWILPDPKLGNTWSIGLWYKDTGTDFTSGANIIAQITQNGMSNAFIGSNGGFIFNTTQNNSTNTYTFTSGKWVNIYIIWDGTNMLTYINSKLFGSSALSSPSVSSGSSYVIGQRYSNTGVYVTGEIGEVRMYNYAITSTQIANNYTETYITYAKYPFTLLVDQKVFFNNFTFTIYEEQAGGSTVPLLIPGLRAWYDGADLSSIVYNSNNNVFQWKDKSGNNYSTTGIVGQPTLNSTGGIKFNGSSNFTLPNGTLPYEDSSYTIIIVSNPTPNTSGVIFGGIAQSSFNWISINGNNSILTNAWNTNQLDSTYTTPNGTNIIYCDYISGGNRTINVNITNLNSDTPGTRTQTNDNNTIGGGGIAGYLTGTINEILVFNRVLTTSERQLLEGYLTWKWNLTKYLPWPHPYKFKQPSIIPSVPINPRSINGLVSWYNFYDSNSLNINSNNKVSAIYDKNYINDLTIVSANLPKFEYGNGLILDGSMFLKTNNFAQNLDNFTIYLVFNQSTQTNNSGILSFISTTGGWDTDINAMSINTGLNTTNFNVATGNLQESIYTDRTTNLYTITSSRVSGVNTLNIYYNGVLDGSIVTSVTNGTSSGFVLGSRYINYANSNGLVGVLKEVLIYNNTASTQTRQEIEGYLSWKWGVENKLNSTHPYRNLPPGTSTKVLDPNSINAISLPTLWLDGNDSSSFSGLTWTDKSNYNVIETYNGTSININSTIIPGMKSIQFLGDNKFFSGNFNINANAFSINFVVNVDPACADQSRILSFYNTGSNDSGIIWNGTSGGIQLFVDSNATYPLTITTGTFNFISYINDPISGNVYTYLNGTQIITDTFNITINTTKLNIGCDGNGNNYTFTGFINEVVCYPYALRNDDRRVLEGYLAWKWQLQSLLPTGHPYFNVPPITVSSSFQPDQVTNLDLWNDANDLIKYRYQDGDNLVNWNNRANTKWYVNNRTGTGIDYPLFKRWGLNSLPMINYRSTSSGFVVDPLNNQYEANNPTLIVISNSNSGDGIGFTSVDNATRIGYINSFKNILRINNFNVIVTSAPTDNNWDNYTLTLNLDGTVSWSNYNINLINSGNRPTTPGFFADLNYHGNGQSPDVYIAEVLLYSKPLPTFYLQKLQGYLCWKWGLQNNLPSSHPYRLQPPNAEESLFTINLKGWTSSLNISTLYLFDTPSNTLLTTINTFYGNDTIGYYATFNYMFNKTQNYLTLSSTSNMIGGFVYPIPTPLIITPLLTISLTPVDAVNTWAYFNISKTFSFTLTSYHLGNIVNFMNYYSTIKIYYADNNSYNNLNLIGNATLTNVSGNLQVSFSFTYTGNIPSLYFYFTYETTPNATNSFISSDYTFIDKSSLSCSLNRYSYVNNYQIYINVNNLPANLYVYYSLNDSTYSNNVYANQKYLTRSINNTFIATFPQPDIGDYYLTISNIGQDGTRTINDININIEIPISVYPVNISITPSIITLTNTNNFSGVFGLTSGNPYSNSNIRIFYSTVIATQNSDLTELPGSPFTVSSNIVTFNFDNSTLLLNSLYFYFTASNNNPPALNTFGHIPLISIPFNLFNLLIETPITYSFNLNSDVSYRLNNQRITLCVSESKYKQIYLYYSNDQINTKPLVNPITGTNLYKINPKNNSINFVLDKHETITYFHGSTEENYTGELSISNPYLYIDTKKFKLNVDNNTITIENYHELLLSKPLYLMVKINNKIINLDQTITLDTNFTCQFKYTFPPDSISNLIVTDSLNINIESEPIYTLNLTTKLNKYTSYSGENSYTMSINNHYNLIKSGNIFINNEPHPKNPFTIKNNQINFNINKAIGDNINSEITFKTLDNKLSVSSSITHKNINAYFRTNYYTINLDNWNPLISSVKLYQNDKYINTFSIIFNKEYYINLNLELTSLDNLSIVDTNWTYPVTNPNNLVINHTFTDLIVSPSSCEINKPTTFYLETKTSFIYTSYTLYHSGKIGSSVNDLTPVTNNKNKIVVTPIKLPLYIITSSVELKPEFINESRIYQYSNSINENLLLKNISLSGNFDQLNTFTIDLAPNYLNIEVNDSKFIIKHTITNNQIIFTYDPGYELTSTFNIINNISKEIYATISVKYI
jgi:hypothetical protein